MTRALLSRVGRVLTPPPAGMALPAMAVAAFPSAATLETKTINIGLQLFAVIVLPGLALNPAFALLV